MRPSGSLQKGWTAELEAPGFIQTPPAEFSRDLGSLDRQLQKRFTLYSETPSLDSKVLLAHILERPKTWVIAHPEYNLDSEEQASLETAVDRLDRGEPLPYVLGAWEFYGLSLKLTPHVLIPRPETELLVEMGLDWLRSRPDRRLAADIGTGSGCIAVALSANLPDLKLAATDISYAALENARQNLALHEVAEQVTLIQTDLLVPIRTEFDLICANLPYIPNNMLKSLPVSAREPKLALDGGPDGLVLIWRLLKSAKTNLSSGGLLLCELEASQGPAAHKAAQLYYPHAAIEIHQDLAGLDRLLAVQT